MISLILLVETVTGAQDVSATKRVEPREPGGRNGAQTQPVNNQIAATGTQSKDVAEPAGKHPDFKVLVWYRRDDPLGTFKYEVYDLRKGEYTAAVDTWISNIQKSYPAYLAVVRRVDLKRERGETEMLKVGSVIRRELMAAAGMAGVFVDSGTIGNPTPALGLNRAPRPAGSIGSLNRPLGSAGIDRSYLNPPDYPFPVPVPYPRPHP
jgi:hypothetical protein